MGHNGKNFRSPLTSQERRATGKRPHNGTDHEGYIVRVRAKRGMRTIPDSWDDLYIHRDKCWKGKRKQQYKD